MRSKINKKRNDIYNKIFIAVFFIILSVPIGFTTLNEISDKKLDIELKGNFTKYDKPDFNLKSFIDTTYQDNFNKWWNNNFISRAFIIKTYNQIRYSMFREGNRIFGKNNDLFEIGYILDYLKLIDAYDFSIENNQNKLKEYLSDIEKLSKNLEKCGKKLIFITSPSKCDYDYKNIPLKYKYFENKNGIRGIDYLQKIIGDYNIDYMDTRKFVGTEQYPIFTKTGIHWSRTAEQNVIVEIVNRIDKKGVSDLPIKKYRLGQVKESNIPFRRDADIYDLTNLWEGGMDSNQKYYEYEEIIDTPKECGDFGILIQGGSFSNYIYDTIIRNSIASRGYLFNYNNWCSRSIYGKQDRVVFPDPKKAYSTDETQMTGGLDYSEVLDNIDIVIIEVNEAGLKASGNGNGFVKFLNYYIENKYVPKGK